jgi:hypothetical protein
MPAEQSPKPRTIAQLNDEFRRSGQDLYITPGVQALPDVPGLIHAVQTFDRFTSNNDANGEHDFGSIVWHTEKIDYYDQALQYWHNPLSPECRRVLTVLLASEY